MRGWFASLPIHRKLIAMALAVSTVAVAAAVTGLLAFDIARFRGTAADDARAIAQIIAANSAAAIVFDDPQGARQILDSVAVRPVLSRACIYGANGTLIAGYERDPRSRCPDMPSTVRGWQAVAEQVPVTRDGRTVGNVYVERLLSDLPARIAVTAAAAVFMLAVAALVAFGLARRMQQTISRPIVALAEAARTVGGQGYDIPPIAAPPDETGALVAAFTDMVRRLAANSHERDELLRREREASRLKDEFLAAVSHELRTPLNAIMGWIQILERTHPDPGTIDKAIASMSRNAKAQSRVIEDLLDISRMISGKLQLTLTAMDLRTALEAAVEVIVPVASGKNITLYVDVGETPCLIQGDFDRIRQILWNLLSNAVKFTATGGHVDAALHSGPDGFSVTVTDSGIGIDDAFLPYVFERFRQADGSTTREHGGLGLGLAIVKELTERHNGRVRAMSPGPGRGATFVVTFPKLLAGAGEDKRPAPTPAVVGRLDGLEVFALDDNLDALEILTSTLSDAGAHVRTATAPAEALAAIDRDPPHVLLCDLAMPEMDGFAVLARIRQSKHAGLPIVAVSAYASDEYRDRCRRAGFQAHVAKPYDVAELVRTIVAVVNAGPVAHS